MFFVLDSAKSLTARDAIDYKNAASIMMIAWSRFCWQVQERNILFNYSVSHSVGGHRMQTFQSISSLCSTVCNINRAEVNSIPETFRVFRVEKTELPFTLPFHCLLLSAVTIQVMLPTKSVLIEVNTTYCNIYRGI